jgi:hypothetical protein
MPSKQVTFQGVLTWDDATQPPVEPPVGIWPGPRPSHPIMLPGMPGWGSGGPRPPVDPGYSPPWAQVPGGQPPYPSTGPGFPTHPIQLPPWAGGWQPHPDNTLPGPQPPWPQPPQPVYPAHPWVPPSGSEGPPVAGWPSVPGNWPSLPGQPPSKPVPPEFKPIAGGQPGPIAQYQWYYSPVYGWVLGVPSGTTPPTEPPVTEPPPTEPPPTEPPA